MLSNEAHPELETVDPQNHTPRPRVRFSALTAISAKEIHLCRFRNSMALIAFAPSCHPYHADARIGRQNYLFTTEMSRSSARRHGRGRPGLRQAARPKVRDKFLPAEEVATDWSTPNRVCCEKPNNAGHFIIRIFLRYLGEGRA